MGENGEANSSLNLGDVSTHPSDIGVASAPDEKNQILSQDNRDGVPTSTVTRFCTITGNSEAGWLNRPTKALSFHRSCSSLGSLSLPMYIVQYCTRPLPYANYTNLSLLCFCQIRLLTEADTAAGWGGKIGLSVIDGAALVNGGRKTRGCGLVLHLLAASNTVLGASTIVTGVLPITEHLCILS